MAVRPGLDKETVVLTAAEMADAEGLENVTLAALAAKLKVKTPSLYNHIDGMKGLRQELALYGIKLLQDQLLQSVIGKSGEPAAMAFGLGYAAFAREHPGVYEATQGSAEYRSPEVDRASEALIRLLLPLLEGLGVTGDEAIHVLRGLRSLLHGFVALESAGGFGMKQDRDESLHFMLKTYLRGLRVKE